MTVHETVAKRTVAAMSWRILPLLGLGYLFALMDRINVSFAALQMNVELGFSATVYGLGAGLFYLAYALFEVPSNLILARVGARRWLARIMISWGLIAGGMMFVQTPLQFYIMRFLLGMAEAGFFPGVLYYLSFWFPRAQRGRAISRFYFFGPLSSVLMGGLSTVLLGLHGLAGLGGWQWLFLVEGLPAAAVGVAILLLLPDLPRSVRWLSAEQCEWIERELANDAIRMPPGEVHRIVDALRHPQVLQFGAIGFLVIGATVTFTLSAPLMLKAAGLPTAEIGGLVSLGGILGVAGMLATGVISDRRGERFATMLVGTALMGLGFTAMAIAPTTGIMMAGTVTVGASWGIVSLSHVSAWPDIFEGKMMGVACAAINTMSQVGAFLMPFAWGRARDITGSPHLGIVSLAIAMGVALVLTWNLRGQVRRTHRPDGVMPQLA